VAAQRPALRRRERGDGASQLDRRTDSVVQGGVGGRENEVCALPSGLSSAGSKVYDESFTWTHMVHVN
jgi:hypothetical protein